MFKFNIVLNIYFDDNIMYAKLVEIIHLLKKRN
jgi:hypothetical protein